MSKPSKQKTDRRRKREAEKRRRSALFARCKSVLSEFPEWHVEPSGAPGHFVKAVEDTVREIALDHRHLLDEFKRPITHGSSITFPVNIGSVFREAKEIGFPLAVGNLRKQASALGMPVNVIHSIASFQFANVFYSLLPAALPDTVSPFHLALVEHGRPHDRAITIRFESLKSEKTPRTRAYYSNRHPTIELGNERRLVGFSRHAVKQIGERLAHGATLYEQAYEAFHFVENSQHFEMVTPREVEAEGGQEEAKQRGARTFTFYIEFEKLDGLYQHAQQVLGPLDKDRRYMLRVGY